MSEQVRAGQWVDGTRCAGVHSLWPCLPLTLLVPSPSSAPLQSWRLPPAAPDVALPAMRGHAASGALPPGRAFLLHSTPEGGAVNGVAHATRRDDARRQGGAACRPV